MVSGRVFQTHSPLCSTKAYMIYLSGGRCEAHAAPDTYRYVCATLCDSEASKLNTFSSSITVFFVCFSLIACSHPFYSKPLKKLVLSDEKKRLLSNKETVKDSLYVQHDKWKGVKYKLGGLSKNGIDCSGFVYLTYLELFGIPLPRSTRLQSQIGKKIQTDKLRSGDLVFFKTGRKVMHVGIYLENNSFLHASAKKGVMISRLDDPYWKSTYWQTKRVGF